MASLYCRYLLSIRFLLLCCLLCGVICGNAQPGKSYTKQEVGKSSLLNYIPNNNDDLSLAAYAIQCVDSISRSSGASIYFARIYYQVMTNIELQIQGFDSASKAFIQKFEIAFADYFIEACRDEKEGNLASSSIWKNLFSNPSTHPARLALMGISAHTNGDLWQALVNNFTGKDIRLHKKKLLSCQPSIAKVFYPFFDSVAEQSRYLKFMRSFTKGLVKNLGERIIYKWRVRQVNLAIMYYKNPVRFNRKLKAVNNKKEKIDRLLLSGIPLILPKS